MRALIFLLVFFQSAYVYAQPPGGGRRGNSNQSQNSGAREVQKFESQKMSGIIEYDSKKTIKKLKLKKSDSVASIVVAKIENHNLQMNKINTENKDLFEGLDIVVNQNMEIARSTQNRELMRETMTMVREKLQPIQEQIRSDEEELNNQLKALLNEDQNEKWLKFQKAEKEKIMPRRRGDDARNRPDNYNNQSRRRRG
ncbi:hypothetical protein [Winogradskyella vincentii]|uniref:LTXXQ motif family protein n=1 Tax=Winogradskyella vincentii TaxID=2877122 RepID=A0ABS7Y216_9FLAO|nr:hypothetical protein [Winogradskyella vincentii]MCA0153937.1 hypothetical protein [Winogradskyella vincentii]